MSKSELYEEAAAHWGNLCAERIRSRRWNQGTVNIAIKAAMCAFIAHPELREG